MERKEPTASLIHTFGDKVGGVNLMAIQQFFVLERIVDLCIRHGTGIEPYVYQVRFTLHGFAVFGYEDDIIHIRTVQVYLIIIFSIVLTGYETFILIRIGLHESGSYGFLYFIIKLFNRTDADFLAVVFRAPDRQRSTPVT